MRTSCTSVPSQSPRDPTVQPNKRPRRRPSQTVLELPSQKGKTRLEREGGTLGLLLTTELEVLASLEGQLGLGLAGRALETENDLLGGLGLLVENLLVANEKEKGG